MYPLNLTSAAAGGYAVANTEDEHIALTKAGYAPGFIEVVKPQTKAPAVEPTASITNLPAPELPDDNEPPTKDELRAKAEALGIEVDSRWGVKRLEDEIKAHGQG